MKRVNVQFHATIDDIYDLIYSILGTGRFNLVGVSFFPNYTVESIYKNISIINIQKYNWIVISKHNIQISNDHNEFIKMQDNNLVIEIGKINENIIKESTIQIFSTTEIDSDWKRIINKFKKNLLRGAWVLNPYNNAREYYKNHMYTNNARLAYEKGVEICPIAGWNLYELTNEQKISP